MTDKDLHVEAEKNQAFVDKSSWEKHPIFICERWHPEGDKLGQNSLLAMLMTII